MSQKLPSDETRNWKLVSKELLSISLPQKEEEGKKS
jgi:hypothetical protein